MKKSFRFFIIFIFLIISPQNLTAKKNSSFKISVHLPAKSLLDFGAVGDGKKNDYEAFLKALDYTAQTSSKILLIPDGYIFNLGFNTVDFNNFTSGVILKFDGGILFNAKLLGNKTKIMADRIRIFDTVNLSGTFISLTDYAYPEWYGTYPNDKQHDLVDALKMLSPVFFDISLGVGDYYTTKGEFPVKGLTGVSMSKTRVYYQTEKSDSFIFSLGKIGGKLDERSYDYNYIKNITMLISGNPKVRQKGNRGIIIGAVHKILLENLKIFQYSEYQMLEKKDLEQFIDGSQKTSEVNAGIEFRGDSEITVINNLYTLSDVGILFSEFTDFVTVRDYTHNCGSNGLATVYFKTGALQSQNILFTGSQSWNQGLFGFFSEKSTTTASFPNIKIENLRIEQLNSEIKRNNKLQGANIWIGGTETISNLQFHNIMICGTSNGIHIGPTSYGRVSLKNIITWSDKKVIKDFALDINFTINSSLIVFLDNVTLMPDAKSRFANGNLMSYQFKKEDTYEGQNLYINDIIIAENSLLKKSESPGDADQYFQKLKIKRNNTDFIALNNSSLNTIKKKRQMVKYEIELITADKYEKFSFIIFPDGKTEVLNNNSSSLFAIGELTPRIEKINLIQDKDSGFIFIVNSLNNDCYLNVTTHVFSP